ncbi:hypothetical protein DY218_15910 [Streptomyces triticagri]|uniref:non-specific serine/threonine protein kinase n=1 Tax=Streptomyces triticagri TaxID=2293568 RepID=A0A372M488_9ACTN|nr:bifunctional serine/threonine-protein kinase/ABC transporter substrate-binding protein [Streptomyces triticagri]RFU85701.1 hypothetical protein DY218_15910 [Streptomyces triticagri]
MGIETGVVLGGKYRLDARLGAGGMGTVWRARDEMLARDVAVKTLQPATESGPGADYEAAVRRFRREARAAGVLDSAHVVPVHDLGTFREPGAPPVPYLVMQLVTGQSLAERLAEESPLAVSLTARVGAQVCQALTAAHAAGVVHRDIKPSNIMLSDGGPAKVVDFGIAKFVADITGNAVTEPDGPAIGSVHYMSPERFRGGEPVTACDLYGLGCVLYEMLTGSPPFTGDTGVEIMQAHFTRAPRAVRSTRPGVPAELDKLVAELLAKTPDARPTAAEAGLILQRLAQELAAATGGHARHTVPPPAPKWRLPRQRWIRAGLVAGAGAAAVALVAGLVHGLGDDQDDKPAGGGAARVIAVVGDFNGEGKPGAKSAYHSVRLALRQAKDLEVPVKVVKHDDSGTADGAERVARRLVDDDRVVAVIGPVGDPGSELMEKASKTYAQAGVVLINPWQQQTGDLGATTYQLMGNQQTKLDATVALLERLHGADLVKGVQYLSDGTDTGTQEMGRYFGATVKSGFPSTSSIDADELAANVRAAMRNDYNVVYYTGNQAMFRKVDTELTKAGFRGLRLTDDASLDGEYQVKSRWLATRDYCSWNDRFDTDYEDAYGDTASLGGVEAYDAAVVVLTALRETPARADHADVRQSMTRTIGELSPKGQCHPDLRFGRDGYLLNPITFLDLYETGDSTNSEIGDISDAEATDQAEKLLK